MARLVALAGPIRVSDTTLPELAGWRGLFSPTPDVASIVISKYGVVACAATKCVVLRFGNHEKCRQCADNQYL